jgi:hypothetical protein
MVLHTLGTQPIIKNHMHFPALATLALVVSHCLIWVTAIYINSSTHSAGSVWHKLVMNVKIPVAGAQDRGRGWYPKETWRKSFGKAPGSEAVCTGCCLGRWYRNLLFSQLCLSVLLCVLPHIPFFFVKLWGWPGLSFEHLSYFWYLSSHSRLDSLGRTLFSDSRQGWWLAFCPLRSWQNICPEDPGRTYRPCRSPTLHCACLETSGRTDLTRRQRLLSCFSMDFSAPGDTQMFFTVGWWFPKSCNIHFTSLFCFVLGFLKTVVVWWG